jgi:hypothetical protein
MAFVGFAIFPERVATPALLVRLATKELESLALDRALCNAASGGPQHWQIALLRILVATLVFWSQALFCGVDTIAVASNVVPIAITPAHRPVLPKCITAPAFLFPLTTEEVETCTLLRAGTQATTLFLHRQVSRSCSHLISEAALVL